MIKQLTVKVSNFFKLLREKGISGLRDRIHRWAWRTYPYVIVRKPLSAATQGEGVHGVEFKAATIDDVPWICRNMSHQGEKAEMLARQYLTGDDLTVIGYLKENPEKLAFLLTATPKDFGVSVLGDVIATGDVGIGRAWVPPDLRSSGIGAQGILYTEYVAYQRGISNFWAFILEDNIPSRKMCVNAGYMEEGYLYLITRFGRRYAKIKRNKDTRWWYVRVPIDASL